MVPETPKLTVDGVILNERNIVLIRRKNPPFRDSWALPGGFVDVGESVEEACIREMKEETSLDVSISRLLGVYSDPARDPRGHTVSVVYICRAVNGTLKGADDASEARWFTLPTEIQLAFDHNIIIEDAIKLLFLGDQ